MKTNQKLVWACFLHFYQPANQSSDIFQRVVSESYRPLVTHLLDNPEVKITLNISGALTEQLVQNNCRDVVDGLRKASKRGQIEFTDSAKYHALLPFLPEKEVIRQIKLNRETNQKFLGSSYSPKGFFPPEMAYSKDLGRILSNLGYEWVILDEIALEGRVGLVDTQTTYSIQDTNLFVFFRERIPSNLIMSALVRRIEDFKDIKDFFSKGYLLTGMDGETFGHHRPGLDKLLLDLLKSNDFQHHFLSDFPELFPTKKIVDPVSSTWASTEKDVENKVQFLTWKDPENVIHSWQWDLQSLARDSVYEFAETDPQIQDARLKLDAALASDHFFWASAQPWWSLEVIESGAWSLLNVIESIPNVPSEILVKARDLYQKIISKAFEWQRTGYIKKLYANYQETPKVPFKDRTKGAGEPWVYNAFVELMRKEMLKAAKKENFEEATLWRDAIWKLETKNDIYDAVHAVDLLRKKIDEGEISDMIGKYRKDYERLLSGQPESRGG